MPRKDRIEVIIVHCFATQPDWFSGKTNAEKMAEVTAWHVRDRGWLAIGYAAGIFRDGEVLAGRDLDSDGDTFEEIGAHVKGQNSRSVGIALEGGHGTRANGLFYDNFTREQDIALRAEIQRIRDYAGWDVPVKGHNEYANKACPGFNVARWFARQAPRTSLTQSTTMRATVGAGLSIVTGAGTAMSQLDPMTQAVLAVSVVVAIACGVWIARERIKRALRGDL